MAECPTYNLGDWSHYEPYEPVMDFRQGPWVEFEDPRGFAYRQRLNERRFGEGPWIKSVETEYPDFIARQGQYIREFPNVPRWNI